MEGGEQIILGVSVLSTREWFAFLISLIAITDPFGFIPVYLGLTKEYSEKRKHKTILIALFSICASLSVAIWCGESILHFFGITIGDFQIAGGLILLTLGMTMMRRSGVATYAKEHDYANNNIGVVPLAVPLVAGPGTFTMILVETHKHDSLVNKALVNLDILAMGLIIGIILYFSLKIHKLIGNTGIELATKIMGMIVLAEAIERITEGLYKNFPILHTG